MHQDLSKFTLPKNFRGKPGWYVQLWWIIQVTLFSWSPQFMYGWRRFLLRSFGAQIGKEVIVRPTARFQFPWKVEIGNYSWIGDNVEVYSLGNIQIGANCCISQRTYLCAGSHELNSISFDITSEKIIIKDQVWLATDVFVAPGVTIEEGCVVGARSSVFKDLETRGVYLGTPAKFIRER